MAAGLLREGLVDEIVAFVAPKIIGGTEASGPVEDLGLRRMADAVKISLRECKPVGGDMVMTGDVLTSAQLQS